MTGISYLLSHLYRGLGANQQAINILEVLTPRNRDSLMELLLVELYFQEKRWEEVVELLYEVNNESPLCAASLWYMARSLEELHMTSLSLAAYTMALKRRKGRDPGFLKRIRYDRALLYKRMGKVKRYRQEMLRLLDEDPEFEDVRERAFYSSVPI